MVKSCLSRKLTASRNTAPANVIVQRLANASSSDRLAGALTALGRIVKTIFVLRYLSDPELRYRVQLQLNSGEARHELVGRCLFFANRGEFRSGDAEEIMKGERMIVTGMTFSRRKSRNSETEPFRPGYQRFTEEMDLTKVEFETVHS